MQTNEDRAGFGYRAIVAGSPDIGMNDDQTDVTDALANIMHYCESKGLDFDMAVGSAEGHFSAELLWKAREDD
jgi:hypothetical protein